ncbi:MAG TPA: hypothetical protein C5S51_00545 [Methanosarcinaceae archaeon]|nr:hypothetical protein [Methanosarcinaceae archaeon]
MQEQLFVQHTKEYSQIRHGSQILFMALLTSAKKDSVIDKRLSSFLIADDAAKQAIERYENFNYLYRYLIRQLNIFDSKGHIRQYDQVKEKMMRYTPYTLHGNGISQ